jgi:hypothetical protein
MKNLDSNGLGVQEMNAEEMVNVEGGNWWYENPFPGGRDGYNPNLGPVFDGLGRPIVIIDGRPIVFNL